MSSRRSPERMMYEDGSRAARVTKLDFLQGSRLEDPARLHRAPVGAAALPAWLKARPAFGWRSGLVVATVALIAIAAALRCFEYDEAYLFFYLAGRPRGNWPLAPETVGALRAALHGASASYGEIAANLNQFETHPPLHFWLMKPWLALFGDGMFAARLFSVACAAGSALVLLRLATLAGAPAIPSLLCGMLGYAVFHTATLARAYALAVLLVLLGALALAEVLRRLQAGSAPRPWAVEGTGLAALAGLCFGLAGYSHYLALLAGAALLGAFGTTALWWRRPLPVLGAALGLLPPFLAVMAIRDGQGTAEWFHPTFMPARDLLRVGEMVATALFARTPVLLDPPWRGVAMALGAASTMVMAATIVFGLRSILANPVRRLLLVGAVSMPVGLLVLSVLEDRAPFVARYASYSVPFMALAFAMGLQALARSGRPRLALAAFLLVVVPQAAGALTQIAWTRTQQEFRPIVAAIEAEWQPGESLLVVPVGYDGIGKNGPYLWEAPQDWPMVVVRGANPMDAYLSQFGAETRRLFVVTFVEDTGTYALRVLRPALEQAGWRKVSVAEFHEVWVR